ncbi:hypothetical protein C0J52_06460 [Blattella germanica]|nr:hypothetical protein C0J52_06460 [Blattella germanica]
MTINGAKILGIFPTPSYSHQQVYQVIMKALATRGHEITVISTDPLKEPVANYTDIDMSFCYKIHRAVHDFESMDKMTPYEFVNLQVEFLPQLTDYQLSSPQLQEFIRLHNNTRKYDLVFLEVILYQTYYGLIHLLGSPPVIGIMPVEILSFPGYSLALPIISSYMSNFMLPYSNRMSFYERFHNLFFSMWMSIKETDKNMSLLMIAADWVFNYPISVPPSIVTFHGVHVKKTSDPLPKELQTFLDKSVEGVIYFSFGSNVHSSRMPKQKIQAFHDAFSELPYKILWKWESDAIATHTSNIMFGKWLPQQDVLAHPNTILFITHCGGMSFQEAVYHAVPILGIPFFGDQKYNVKKITEANIGIHLPFQETTKETLLNAINKILEDPSYRNNMEKLSSISKDQPQDSIEKAVWWTEYVLRHGGARHLRSAAVDLNWYQYLLLDVMSVLIISILFTLFLCYIIVKVVSNLIAISLTKHKLD